VTISFARGIPPPDCLPTKELADCARAAADREGRSALNYGPVMGFQPLRHWIAERHGVDESRVFVTNGSLQAIALLVHHLVSTGAPALVEAPTYDRPLRMLADLGVKPLGIPLGDDGHDLDALTAAATAAANRQQPFLYTIPTFQNPTGRTLPLPARSTLAELAQERRLLVVEDDPYGLVRFSGEPLPTVFELAGGEGVVYLSSFSKVVAPGLRVAYAILPPDLLEPIADAATYAYLSPGTFAQATVHEFLRRGNLEPNLERLRLLLRERRDAMLGALEEQLAGRAAWTRPDGGYFLWLELPGRTDVADLLARATAQGVTFVKGEDFFPRDVAGARAPAGGASSARLAYSFVSPGEIRTGVDRLARALERAPALAVPV
jgi:2-aminoadipate transaminase